MHSKTFNATLESNFYHILGYKPCTRDIWPNMRKKGPFQRSRISVTKPACAHEKIA